jgi:hypothetical protein
MQGTDKRSKEKELVYGSTSLLSNLVCTCVRAKYADKTAFPSSFVEFSSQLIEDFLPRLL